MVFGIRFDTVRKLDALNELGQLVFAIQLEPLFLGGHDQLEDHDLRCLQ